MSSEPEGESYEGPRLPPERAWLMIGYQRMITLVHSTLPRTITADGLGSPQEDWRVVQPAFLARIGRIAQSLCALVPLDARLDAMNLARTQLEYATALAWIAADPDTRFEIWLKMDYRSRLDLDKKVRRRIDAGTEGRWGNEEPPLTSESRAEYRKLVRRVANNLPGLPKMAEAADEYWLSRYPAGLANQRAMSLVDLYENVYDAYSWVSHPRLLALQAFWDVSSQWVVIHPDERPENLHDPLHMGQLLTGVALLVAAMSSGSPTRRSGRRDP